MLRRAIIDVRWLALALLLVPGGAGAQSMGGGFIQFTPAGPASSGFVAGSPFCIGDAASPCLYREAANSLSFYNSTNAQTFYVYNTRTDGSNYERGYLKWNANAFEIGTGAAGTGTQRATKLLGPGGLIFTINSTFTFNAALVGSVSDVLNVGSASALWKNVYVSQSVQGSKPKTLTDAAAAAAVWSCAVPTSDYLGGELIWTTKSTDATDLRATQGRIRFAGVNKAGTTTCTVNVVGTDLTASSNANTLVCTWTNVASSTNCELRATCTDNTAGTQTMSVNSRLDMPLPQTCTAQ